MPALTDEQRQIELHLNQDSRFWADLSAAEKQKIQFNLSRASFQLLIHYPFFGFLVAQLANGHVMIKTKEQLAKIEQGLDHDKEPDIKWRTMATDGKVLYIWPQYLLYNSIPVIMGTLLHEAMHVILYHTVRARGYPNKRLFNISADLSVNMMINDFARDPNKTGRNVNGYQLGPLSTADYEHMPFYIPCPPGFYDDRFREENGDPWMWEKIYRELERASQEEPQKYSYLSNDEEGQVLDNHDLWVNSDRPANDDGEVNSQHLSQDDVREMVRDAYIKSSNAKGTIPERMVRLIDEYLNPSLPWQRLVQQYLRPANGWFGYQPGDLRFQDPIPWFIPDQKLRYILITIDTSGSMSNKEVEHAIAEARLLLRSFPETKGILCMCDAGISYWDDLDKVYTLRNRHGLGGTEFSPPFIEAVNRKIANQIDLHIYFTDGYGNFPDQSWLTRNNIPFDTLWVITNDTIDVPKVRQYRSTRLIRKE